MKICKFEAADAIDNYLKKDADDVTDVLEQAARIIVGLFQRNPDTIQEIKEVILMAALNANEDVEIT